MERSRVSGAMVTFAMLGGLLAAPAHATCMKTDSALPRSEIFLTSPKGGKPIRRVTDGEGLLKLRGLRAGEWTGRMAGLGSAARLTVTRDGRLVVRSVRQTVQCHAPPGPNGVQMQSHPSIRNVVVQVLR